MSGEIIVFVTAADLKQAEKIAAAVLEEKLAACVNIVPGIISSYWWRGKIEKSEEVLLILKTKKPMLQSIIRSVKKNHSYEVPEVVALNITGGNRDYLKWIGGSLCRKRCSRS